MTENTAKQGKIMEDELIANELLEDMKNIC